jgi:uncharacterized protein RhaS with RHS repeats
MQARYYDPVIGRFYSNDPADSMEHMSENNLAHGFNRYKYGNNNPYKYVDPDGRFELPFNFGSLFSPNKGADIVQSKVNNTSKAVSNNLKSAVDKVESAVDSVAPSQETAHTIGTIAAVGLTVASVTTPCTALCANTALAISSMQAVDNLAQGKPVDAALNLLPAGAGKVTSTIYKGSAQLTKSEAGAIVDAGTTVIQELQ